MDLTFCTKALKAHSLPGTRQKTAAFAAESSRGRCHNPFLCSPSILPLVSKYVSATSSSELVNPSSDPRGPPQVASCASAWHWAAWHWAGALADLQRADFGLDRGERTHGSCRAIEPLSLWWEGGHREGGGVDSRCEAWQMHRTNVSTGSPCPTTQLHPSLSIRQQANSRVNPAASGSRLAASKEGSTPERRMSTEGGTRCCARKSFQRPCATPSMKCRHTTETVNFKTCCVSFPPPQIAEVSCIPQRAHDCHLQLEP